MAVPTSQFNIDCTDCSRLANFLQQIKLEYPDYHARPVCPFGASKPALLIVGLAPGMHGANASGRPFTGDHAGILLYQTLYRYGFSTEAVSKHRNDKLKLKECRITNAVKCLPPENKPTAAEINTCNHFLSEELKATRLNAVILCLGLIAHKAVIKALDLKQASYTFGHAKEHKLDDGRTIIDSYHCSRYNTQTGRLTEAMFNEVFRHIREELLAS